MNIKSTARAHFKHFALAVAGILMFMNCDNVHINITPIANVQTLSANFPQICASAPDQTKLYYKIMFLVDMSGSNAGASGTDPDKSFRNDSIKNFVDAHATNTQIQYGFIGFQDAGGNAYINSGSTATATFSDATAAYAALAQFEATADAGATPYKATLAMAESAIVADRILAKAANQQTKYSVVLLSDGVPSDYGTPINDTALDADVQSLIVSGGGATLSTVYYGPAAPNDAGASARLQRVAVEGGGGFTDTNVDGRNVPLSNIITFSDQNSMVIRRFMVSNITASPCDDGTMGADSDADGLCDVDENTYNKTLATDPTEGPRMSGHKFNPVNRNSFGNAYNDYINYRHVKYGEALDSTCTTMTSTSGDLLNDCEKLYLKATSPDGPTTTWTSKMGILGDPKNFDSDGDGFIDYIELIFGRSRSAALDYNSTTQTIQGYTMDQILMQHRNPANPTLATPYDPNFHFVQANDQGQNCYSYTQSVLPLYHTQALPAANTVGFPALAHATDENVVLIYYIETQDGDPNGTGEIHYQFQKIKYGTSGTLNLNLDPSSFTVYEANSALASD